jgi:hypothetical protein
LLAATIAALAWVNTESTRCPETAATHGARELPDIS